MLSPPFLSCPTGTTRSRRPPNTQPDPCEFPDLVTVIAIHQTAHVSVVYGKTAGSTINLQQRAPAYWDLSAESNVVLTSGSERQRDIPRTASSNIVLSLGITTAGVATATAASLVSECFDAVNGSAVITLSDTDISNEQVYLNGLRQRHGATYDYTINYVTGVITFNFNLVNDAGHTDIVCVDYEL